MKAFFTSLLVACVAISCTAKRENRLVVGTGSLYPPYTQMGADGKIEGFDIDIANLIGAELHQEVEIREMGFDALIVALRQGKIDLIISGMSITPAREAVIDMLPYQGAPMRHLELVFWEMVPEEIKGPIAVEAGTFQEDYIRQSPYADMAKPLDSTLEVVMDIRYGKSQGALLEPHRAAALEASRPHVQRVKIPLDESMWTAGVGIGINKQNSALKRQVEKALIHLTENGKIAAAEKRWFTEGSL